jgi:hypothetical protein
MELQLWPRATTVSHGGRSNRWKLRRDLDRSLTRWTPQYDRVQLTSQPQCADQGLNPLIWRDTQRINS